MTTAVQEALRAAERVLDHQATSLISLRGDLERLMRLGIAAIAGTLASVGLLVQSDAMISGAPATAIGLGVVGQVFATGLASGVAQPSDMSMGPSPRDLFLTFDLGTPDEGTVRLALLEQAAIAHRHNEASLRRTSRRARGSSVALMLGSSLVLSGIAYVVGGAIFV